MTKGLLLTSVLFSILFFFLLGIFLLFQLQKPFIHNIPIVIKKTVAMPFPTPTFPSSPLAISLLQKRSYLGSAFHIENQLADGINYHKFIVSYQSDGLTIFALLTIPFSKQPLGGFPAILFNHGYIPPTEYQTVPTAGQYASYVDSLARQGYVIFKPDYRGNGHSQGIPEQIYVSSAYIIDDLNALASLRMYPLVNKNKIGLWGHSMGGAITLYDVIIAKTVKAAVIWSGVVGSIPEILAWWPSRQNIVGNDLETRIQLQKLVQHVGTPQTNPSYWQAVDPTNFLQNITIPIQIHVGLSDQTVPPDFSINLAKRLQVNGKNMQLYEYPGNDHNLSQSYDTAMERTITFFDTYLKSNLP